MELYKKYRPKSLKGLIGQASVVQELQKKLDKKQVPHTMILSGTSGSGKTSTALILAKLLGAHKHEVSKVNAASFRGIDAAREIIKAAKRRPMFGPCRVWIIDEAHRLTRDAQESLLDILEFTPKHAYFFLCTTDSGLLIKTIQNRATEIKFKPIGYKDLLTLLQKVVEREGKELSEEVIERIAEVGLGSARKALVILDQVIDLDTEKEQLAGIVSAESRYEAKEIFSALLNPRTTWGDMAKILKGVKEDAEGVRRYVLAAARNVLLSGGKMSGRAALIIRIFGYNLFDSGDAGLAGMAYDVLQSTRKK